MAAAFVKGLVYGANSTSETSTVATGGQPYTVTVGNTIFVLVATYGAGPLGAESCSDNLGNVYSLVGSVLKTSDNEAVALFAAPVTVGGSLTTITAVHRTSSNNEILSAEFSGVGAISGSAYTATGTGTTSTFLSAAAIPAGGIAIGVVMASVGGAPSAGAASGTPSTSITEMDHWTSPLPAGMYYALTGVDVTGFDGTATRVSSSDWAAVGAVYSPPGAATDSPFPFAGGGYYG